MTVRVGVIGTGMIGEDHVRRLTRVVAGASVTAVTDVDKDRAAAVTERFGVPTVHANGEDVIADDQVDAVVVASWGPTHAEYVLASIAAGKPVFCEKPLATTPEACSRILDAEIAAGRRLVQVGFMRRYDEGYRALKIAAANGSIGAPLLAHMAHRNPAVPPTVTSEMAINDSVVHEIDVTRWLLDEEITSVMILAPKRSRKAADGLQDPMVVVFRTGSGVLVDDELSVNVGYGYDIQAEIVGESGNARLGSGLGGGAPIVVTTGGGRACAVPADWRERFISAYDEEFREWIDDVAAGREASGPSSWDGYAAAVVAGACITALHGASEGASGAASQGASGAASGWAEVVLQDRPDFYRR
jgi:myo-inositol 2-dehydrogenase / D-chiro-inositol 1-dehydrogenase